MNNINPVNCINALCRICHENSKQKGFWEQSSNIPEKLALIHSEVSEALEAVRHGYPVSDHLPNVSLFEEELADICIRVFDLAQFYGINLGRIIDEKIEYNKSRPHMHGKKC